MELQIQDLVTSIRKEGVEAASAEAEAIIAEAKKKADKAAGKAKPKKQVKSETAPKTRDATDQPSVLGRPYLLSV